MAKSLMKSVDVTLVACEHCGKQHDITGETYIQVQGQILVGEGGGIIGGTGVFDKNFKLLRAAAYCTKCFYEIFDGYRERLTAKAGPIKTPHIHVDLSKKD